MHNHAINNQFFEKCYAIIILDICELLCEMLIIQITCKQAYKIYLINIVVGKMGLGIPGTCRS